MVNSCQIIVCCILSTVYSPEDRVLVTCGLLKIKQKLKSNHFQYNVSGYTCI